jgi:hypothetical protein
MRSPFSLSVRKWSCCSDLPAKHGYPKIPSSVIQKFSRFSNGDAGEFFHYLLGNPFQEQPLFFEVLEGRSQNNGEDRRGLYGGSGGYSAMRVLREIFGKSGFPTVCNPKFFRFIQYPVIMDERD